MRIAKPKPYGFGATLQSTHGVDYGCYARLKKHIIQILFTLGVTVFYRIHMGIHGFI